MTETEIAQMNERVAVAMGWIPSHDQRMFPGQWESPGLRITQTLPDFYHDIRLCGEMMEWLSKHDDGTSRVWVRHRPERGWQVTTVEYANGAQETLNAALCRAIDAIAKGRET